jgi:competence ComEA-like helix-hairpin-helix protein
VVLDKLVNPKIEGLESLEKIQDGIKNIISHLITKNSEVLTEVRKLRNQFKIILSSSQVKAKKSKDQDNKNQKKDEFKFENYFDFSMPTAYLKSHQILAINRGETMKSLAVKLQIDERVRKCLKYFVQNLFPRKDRKYQELFEESFNEAYTKKIAPLIQRQERAELTKRAEKASIEVFANNLKQLLLLSPNREVILGIDPGFSNGCKLAMISKWGDVLETSVFYLHTSNPGKSSGYSQQLSGMLRKHGCELIAVGNGTACRETESWITGLYESGVLGKNVRYCIVNEQGASIYSCSPLAKKEFPDLDVNLVSAVSIARRLLDPLAEYVKIDAKHLGLGQYQHDINEKSLTTTLNEIVSECVSFVGVDINSTSHTLLSHIAGLSEKRAEAIIQHRVKNGPFQSREDILKVKGIGKIAYKNCGGFLRIDSKTSRNQYYNLLDSTWIHPESYDLAGKIIKELGLSDKDVGKSFFIQKFKENAGNLEKLAGKFREPIEKIEMIFGALQRELTRDYRADVDNKPLFKQGLTKIGDLRVGQVLSGAITNNTDFGSFVDIGVHVNGLIHKSKMNGMVLKINDKVEVKILSLEIEKGRIGLGLNSMIC